MTQRDLQELELAARIIIAVIERNHVSDEDATERRAKFILFPGGEKEKSPAVTTGGEKKKRIRHCHSHHRRWKKCQTN